MEEQVISKSVKMYYQSERTESIFMFIWGGLVSCIIVWTCFKAEELFWSGLGYSIIFLSLIQFISGGRNLFFLNKKRKRVAEEIRRNRKKGIENERIRILNTQIRLRFYRLLEQILLILGLIFLIMGGLLGWSAFLAGSGLGLLIQISVMLVQDLFAEWRTNIYLEELEIAENR